MVIHNATFMIDREHEESFLEWLKNILPTLGALRNPRLSSMREAGGIDYLHAEAQSVALQCEFDNTEEALRWRTMTFADVAAAFSETFAPNAMVFTSIFEQISL